MSHSKKAIYNIVIKFGLRLDIHMKIILYGWIDNLHFDNEEPIHNTEAIRAMHNIDRLCAMDHFFIVKIQMVDLNRSK
jgi:hypothetical protein